MPTLRAGGSSRHSSVQGLHVDRWRRWAPLVVILCCVLVGWIHGTFFIPQKPDGVSASKWALRESQAIQDGANYALLLIAGAAWIHRRRLAALQWLVLESFKAHTDERLVYETELEALRLPDEQRALIVKKAGLK